LSLLSNENKLMAMQKVYFFGEYEPWKSQSKGALPYLEMEGG
jgi:hypothetical protein